MTTLIVGLILAGIVCLAIRSLWRDHKAGKTCGGCSGDCTSCHSCGHK